VSPIMSPILFTHTHLTRIQRLTFELRLFANGFLQGRLVGRRSVYRMWIERWMQLGPTSTSQNWLDGWSNHLNSVDPHRCGCSSVQWENTDTRRSAPHEKKRRRLLRVDINLPGLTNMLLTAIYTLAGSPHCRAIPHQYPATTRPVGK